MIIHSNKPDSQEREHLFNIVSGFYIIAPQTRQVFYHNTVNPAISCILQHPLKLRTFKICTSKSVIHINIRQHQIWSCADVFHQQIFLVLHGIRIFFSIILHRKAKIDASMINPCLLEALRFLGSSLTGYTGHLHHLQSWKWDCPFRRLLLFLFFQKRYNICKLVTLAEYHFNLSVFKNVNPFNQVDDNNPGDF